MTVCALVALFVYACLCVCVCEWPHLPATQRRITEPGEARGHGPLIRVMRTSVGFTRAAFASTSPDACARGIFSEAHFLVSLPLLPPLPREAPPSSLLLYQPRWVSSRCACLGLIFMFNRSRVAEQHLFKRRSTSLHHTGPLGYRPWQKLLGRWRVAAVLISLIASCSTG